MNLPSRSLFVLVLTLGLTQQALGDERNPMLQPGAQGPEQPSVNVNEQAAATPPAPARAAVSSTGSAPQLAVATNLPLMWPHSMGASVYLAPSRQGVLRLNLAHYEDLAIPAEDAPTTKGRITDVGIGWNWYLLRRWRGPMVELGALARIRDLHTSGEDSPTIDTDTTEYAVRAMLGWTWMLGDHVFIASAVGYSVGYERGDERVMDERNPRMPGSSPYVKRRRTEPEAYLRVGWVFEE